MGKLFGIFILVPLIELLILIKVEKTIGFWWTIAAIILTAGAGASLARAQGIMVFWKIRQELNTGRIPAGAMLESVLILFAGVFLLTPGFITDLIGFSILIPPVRKFLRTVILTRIQIHMGSGFVNKNTRHEKPQNKTDDIKGEVKSTWRVELDREYENSD